MAYENQSEDVKSLAQRKYNDDAKADRVVIRAQDPDSGEWVNIGATDNGDGTFSLRASPTYTTRIDEASATVTYIGDAAIGSSAASAVWRIKKIDTSSGTAITFADGDGDFNNIWNNRASLSYS